MFQKIELDQIYDLLIMNIFLSNYTLIDKTREIEMISKICIKSFEIYLYSHR